MTVTARAEQAPLAGAERAAAREVLFERIARGDLYALKDLLELDGTRVTRFEVSDGPASG